jgi:hypothetical protein
MRQERVQMPATEGVEVWLTEETQAVGIPHKDVSAERCRQVHT